MINERDYVKYFATDGYPIGSFINGRIPGFADTELYEMAKKEAGFEGMDVPEVPKPFKAAWSDEAWMKIVRAGYEIVERTGSIYPPWKEKI